MLCHQSSNPIYQKNIEKKVKKLNQSFRYYYFLSHPGGQKETVLEDIF